MTRDIQESSHDDGVEVVRAAELEWSGEMVRSGFSLASREDCPAARHRFVFLQGRVS